MNRQIKELRERLGLSQRNFAEKINVGQSTLAMFETGQRELKDIHIHRICSEFGVSESWLRRGEGEMFVSLAPDMELAELMGGVLGQKDEFTKTIIKFILQKGRKKEEWDAVKKFILELANTIEDDHKI